MFSSKQLFERRRARNRTALKRVASGQPRLSVNRSSKHIYAQVIDDNSGETLASASTLDATLKSQGGTSNSTAAAAVGKLVAERAREQGVEIVVFDRGGYIYHGRVKALAEAAREAGLTF
jgi:large subunit ribosomal protein L18